MIRKTLGLTFASLSSAFLLLLVLSLPQSQAAVKTPRTINPSTIKSAVYTKVTPIKTMPLRDMRNLNQPPIMRTVMGNRTYTQQQTEQLRAKLFGAGYLKPPKAPYLIPVKTLKPTGVQTPKFVNPTVQHSIGHGLDFTSSFAFPGIGKSDQPNPDTIGCAPPDTDNAVGFDSAAGSDVVVELVNLCNGTGVGSFKVWNASSGAVIQDTTSLGGLWSTSDCQNGGGDNQVNYDQFAHRWWMSQFNSSYTGVCVAISASDDPTGSYYLYDIVMDANGFTDYPKMGKWITGDDNSDAYFLSANDFPPAACGNCVVYTAVQRSAMLTGSPAGVLTIIGPNYATGLDFSALPADVDGTTMPPLDAPEYYVDYISPYYYGGSTYALEMWQMSVDWGGASASLTGPTEIDVDPFEDGDFSCAPQPSPGECLPVLGDRLMYRLAYRNGYTGSSDQVLLVNHAVVDTSQGDSPIGIDWYELNAVSGSTSASDWGISQQGLYAPADGNSRFMGSISMDHVGNIALGYTISSTTMDASVAVAGQNVGAPSGVMDAAEQILITGSGQQTSTGRWGDYSAIMASATDDCTFWTAQEYISDSGSFFWSTGNAAVKFSNCSIGPVGTLTGTVTNSGTGNPLAGAHVTLTPGNITGTTNAGGHYTMTVPIGDYTATASDYGYLSQSDPETITDGGTTNQDFALDPAPTASVSGNVADASPSGHTYGLYSEVKVTTPGYGQVADIWTNPQTGAYSVNLPEGADYTFNTTAYLSGYDPGSDTITGLSGNTTEDIGLMVGSSCTAPGYALAGGLAQNFEGSFPPSGWTVVNDVDNGATYWERNDSYGDGNFTNGSGFAAEANNDHPGPGLGPYSTQLITPAIDVASLAGTTLKFTYNYVALDLSALDLDISTDGGATWTNITTISSCGSLYSTPGCDASIDIGSFLPGSGTFQLRWHYYDTDANAWDWYAQIDNVLLGAGCAPIAGGLVEGSVTDQNTGSGIVGAAVSDSDTPSNSVKTANNAADPNLPPAYYFLFSNANGSDVITAASANYTSGTANLNVTDNSVTQQDFALGAAQFNATPGFFHLHVMVGTNVDQYLTINNTGSADGNYSFQTFDFPPPAGSQGHGAQLNQIHCDNLSPLSMAWLQNHNRDGGGYDPGCGIGDDDSFTRAPPNDPAWVAITDYPGGIMDNAVAADEGSGKVYSVGGVDGSGTTTAAGNVYDPGTSAWTAIAPLPSASEKPASAFIGGKLYVADGWDSLGNPTATLRIYDPSTNTWSTGANNPAPEGGGAGVAVLNNKMILIGGCPTGSSCGDTPVVEYDPASDSWTTLASYPHQISWESCGTVSGTLYCAGGTTTSEYADGYVYDASANSWSPIANIPVSAGGLWASGYSGTSQGLLISGGITNGSITNIGFIYDPGSNSWSTLPNSINSLYRGGSACGFYKVGGSTGGFIGMPGSELLSGYSPCGSSPIPWLGINPATGTVPAGGSVQVRFRFKSAGQQEYTLSHAYVLLQGTPYAPQLIDLKVHWDPQPIDLKVKVTPSLNKVYQGGIVVFHVKVKNRPLGAGYGPASGVTLTYPLPAGADVLNMTGPGSCSVTSGVATCTFGTLAQGEAQEEDFFVVPSVAGTMVSTFSDTANEPDINPANNTKTVDTTVVGVAHVTLDSYTVNRGTANVGEQVTFNLGVSNKGPDTATGVLVTAPLPANMTYVSSTASSGNCANKGGLVTCNIGALTKGGQATVNITATVKSAGKVTTMARVSAETKDPNLSNRTRTVNITVNANTGITRGGN